jgi:hypothetical protein
MALCFRTSRADTDSRERGQALAYLRGDPYVYRSGDDEVETLVIHTEEGSVHLRMEDFDALVAMRWAQLGEKGRSEACRYAIERGSGNFGTDALRSELGLPTAMQWLVDLAQRYRDERA